MNNIINDLAKAIAEASKPKTSAYDTAATVVRIEGGTAWVHIPGGVDETPVKLTINAAVGDTVQVRVSGGRAFLVGNASAPPTDDKTATQALQTIDKTNKFVETVKTIAEKAAKIAGNTNQYFWHTETGEDTGAHITEIPQEEFLADPENGGGNLLARSNGIAIRDGLTEVSAFDIDSVRLGQEGATHTNIDYHSLQLVDKEGNTYFHVSDLRTNDSDTVAITEVFQGDGVTQNFQLGARTDSITECKIDGTVISTSAYRLRDRFLVHFETAPNDGAVISVAYLGTGSSLKALTFGSRGGDTLGPLSSAIGMGNIASAFLAHAEGSYTEAKGHASHAEGSGTQANGPFSHAEGVNTIASNMCDHAEGLETTASGQFSHAEGYGSIASGGFSHAQNQGTITAYNDQTAIGKYNDNQSDNAFEIGNGNLTSRSNAFTVDWDGNTQTSGTLIAGAVTSFEPTWASGHTPANYHCIVSAGICSFSYRGPTIAHAANTTICTLPVGARPTAMTFAPCVKMGGGVVGCLRIYTTGVVEVMLITDTASTGRLYFNCSFPVV